MARVLSMGFEENSNSSIELNGATGSPVIQTAIVRSGTYAGQITSLVSGTRKCWIAQFASAAGNGPYFARGYFYFTAFPSAENFFFCFRNNASLGVSDYGVTIDSTGALRLYNLSTLVGIASAPLNLNQWYKIELRVDLTASQGSRIVEARINEVVFATTSTATANGGALQSVEFGGNLNAEANTQGTWYIDDIAVNDSTGSYQTAYPTAGNIVHLRPNAAGDNNAFATQVGGTAGSSNNFTRVDEVTPNDATDYNADTTLNNIDDFNIDNTTLPTDALVNVVSIGVRTAGAGASANSSVVARCKKTSGGTVAEGSTITPASTSWNSNGAFAANYTLTLYQDPDGNSWTKATLDTAQIGYRLSATNTNAAQVTAVWMLVEYSPAAYAIMFGGSIPNTFITSKANVVGY